MAGYIGTKAVNLSTTGADIAGDADVSGALDVGGAFTSQGIDDNATSTAMTLDASGRLLHGKTTNGDYVTGTEIQPAGAILSYRSGGVAAIHGRTDDGEIIRLTSNSSIVGRIGTNSGRFAVYGTDRGIRFTASELMPTNGSGTATDDILSVGHPSYRFKDLYLSGGVYLGGTGSANKLDDYEEGTFSPGFVDGSGNSISGFTYSSQNGSYTKIGNMVNVRIVIGTSATPTGTTAVSVSLPFTVTNAGNYAYGAAVAPLVRYITFGTSGYVVVETSKNKPSAALIKVTSGTTTSLITPNDMGSSISLNASITYQTDS